VQLTYTEIMAVISIAVILFGFVGVILLNRPPNTKRILSVPFPGKWRSILRENILFYSELDPARQPDFEKRVQLFIATKKITPIDTTIDDRIRIMVAASAIIPVFAFPLFNYPKLREVLIYPNRFDEKFQTAQGAGEQRPIIGMVGNRFMNGTMIISKPDLERAYDGTRRKNNVGVHEFVHLIDNLDGETDGIPDILLKHPYVIPWLELIQREMEQIKSGDSDIGPYAVTNKAEFLAVVSEYFFSSPQELRQKHPELYESLSRIFHP